MIITESESNDSKASTVHSGGSEAPASPPPYTPSLPAQSQYNSDHKPLPTPPFSPPQGSMSDPNAGPAPRADLPPRCNHLIAKNQNSGVKGVWHIDTALAIPEALLAPLEDFDGVWNENDQNRRKKDKKGKRSSDSVPTVSSVAAVRPNLMLKSKNGSVTGEVHVVSSDGVSRPALVVAEGHNGSVTLEVRAHAEQPLRIFATSENGSVRLRIPQSFEGAVTMSTRNGTVKFSDPLKARLTTFSAASSTTRGFIGDWQAANFGSVPPSPVPSPDPNADPPLPTTPSDPFTTWTGPLVHLASHNGSVHLSFSDEEPVAGTGGGAGFSSAVRGFMTGLFGGGGGGQGDDRGDGGGLGRGRGMGMGGGPWGPGGGPWSHGGGPFGRGGGPFSPGNVPFAPGGMPFAPGGGPFGRGGGPFACGGGPFARGGGSPSNMREYEHGRRGSFGRQSGSSCRSRREDGPQDQEAPGYDGKSWLEPENENGYPMDKKGPI